MKSNHAAVELGARLRSLRKLKGLSEAALAGSIGISQPSLSRIERGASVPTASDLVKLTTELNVHTEIVPRLLRLRDSAYETQHPGRLKFINDGAGEYVVTDYERDSKQITYVDSIAMPGLLQTQAYAAEILSLVRKRGSNLDVDTSLALRLERQAALLRSGNRHRFLISEQAMRLRCFAPDVHVAQLQHLRYQIERQHHEIAVMPSEIASNASIESGAIFDEHSVLFETWTGSFVVSESLLAKSQMRRVDAAMKSALQNDEAIELINRTIAYLTEIDLRPGAETSTPARGLHPGAETVARRLN